MTKKKIYLQCGYEDECKKRDCRNCKKNRWSFKLTLSQAEQIVIEDFAVCDLEWLVKNKPKELDLMQNVMWKITKKIFKQMPE